MVGQLLGLADLGQRGHKGLVRNMHEKAVAEDQVRQLIRELYEGGDRQRAEELLTGLYAQMSHENTRLQMRVQELTDRIYGRKSEKVDPNQLRLSIEEMRAEEFARQDAEAPASNEEPASEPPKPKPAKRRHPGRRALPQDLPRIPRRHQCTAEELTCECCGRDRRKIREEISERLDYRPASFVVIQDIHDVYACGCGQSKPVTAAGPSRALEGGIPEPGLLAKVAVAKYKDKLPLYRQVEIYKREGVELCANTMVGWIAAVAWLLTPLYRAINKRVVRSWVVQSDDTGLTVLDRAAAKGSRRGRIWANIGDDVWIVFHYSPNWKHEHPQRFLKGVCGYLQTDGYEGYKPLTRMPTDEAAEANTESSESQTADETKQADEANADKADLSKAIAVGCWMHARRYFHKAYKAKNPLAAVPLDIIQRMYKIERASKKAGDSPGERFERRRRHSLPLLDEFKTWLDEHVGTIRPTSPLGKAITYARNQWGPLQTFLLDGHLEIDNGAVERALRGVAVGRKNWLFAGSDEGAERAAVLFTVIETAVRHGHDPQAYLTDVIDKLAAGWSTVPLDDLVPELLPDRWTAPASGDADAGVGEPEASAADSSSAVKGEHSPESPAAAAP